MCIACSGSAPLHALLRPCTPSCAPSPASPHPQPLTRLSHRPPTTSLANPPHPTQPIHPTTHPTQPPLPDHSPTTSPTPHTHPTRPLTNTLPRPSPAPPKHPLHLTSPTPPTGRGTRRVGGVGEVRCHSRRNKRGGCNNGSYRWCYTSCYTPRGASRTSRASRSRGARPASDVPEQAMHLCAISRPEQTPQGGGVALCEGKNGLPPSASLRLPGRDWGTLSTCSGRCVPWVCCTRGAGGPGSGHPRAGEGVREQLAGETSD